MSAPARAGEAPFARDPIDVPDEWRAALDLIGSGTVRRVLVLGPGDSGKTSFSRAAFAATTASGRMTALLDCDVGQKIVGPPAAVTLAQSTSPEALSEMAFVGTTDQVAGFARVIDGMTRLLRHSRPELLITNTSGVLAGPGLRLKAAKVALLEPDLVITVGEDPKLDALITAHPELHLRRLPRSPQARRKTRAARRAARRAAFRHYFDGARVLDFPIGAVRGNLRPSCEGLLVGLRADDRDIAMGLVHCLSPDADCIEVLAPALPLEAHSIVPGLMRLGGDFVELSDGAS